jgi:hypothetical protein
MNYEEYKEKRKQINLDINDLFEKKLLLKRCYINDNAKIPFKKRQIIELTLENGAAKSRNGGKRKTYKVIGMIVDYDIVNSGELRPEFYGVVDYPSGDKIISICAGKQKTKRCVDCDYFTNYNECIDDDVKADDFVCPCFKDKK